MVGKNAKLVALPIVGLCLAEGINQLVIVLVIDSQLVAKCQIRDFIPNCWNSEEILGYESIL